MGDFKTNTGPGVANKMLMKGLKANKNVIYSNAENKIYRVFEMIYKIAISNCVCFCSPSKANIIGILISKLFRKKSFYIMHGYLTYEEKINNTSIDNKSLQKINRFEKYIFKNVDKVFCVSKKFMEYMKKAEPLHKDKFDYNYNGLDLDEIQNAVKKYDMAKNHNQIVSVGGGMPRKNNLTVCKAIAKLNRENKMGLKFIVIGLPYSDKHEICSYDFVTYYDKLPHEKVIEIMASSYLYIQNSSFETFGLAVIEGIISNCNLLVSEKVGATSIIETIGDEDMIFNTFDEREIAEKIERVMKNNNVERLKKGINKDKILYTKASNILINKICKYMGGK